MLSVFLPRGVERLGYTVGVECECVSTGERTLPGRAVPFLEQPQHSAGGAEPFQRAISAQKQRTQMSAIYITQALRPGVILGIEQGGVGAVGRILIKQAIGQLQKTLRLIQRD